MTRWLLVTGVAVYSEKQVIPAFLNSLQGPSGLLESFEA
jgi:hypothetical protein